MRSDYSFISRNESGLFFFFFYLAAREWDADDADRLLLKELVGDRHCCECVMREWSGVYGMKMKKEKKRKKLQRKHVLKAFVHSAKCPFSMPNQGSSDFLPTVHTVHTVEMKKKKKKVWVGYSILHSVCSFTLVLCSFFSLLLRSSSKGGPTNKQPLCLVFFCFLDLIEVRGSLTLPAHEILVQKTNMCHRRIMCVGYCLLMWIFCFLLYFSPWGLFS